jgi:hypothetical protein
MPVACRQKQPCGHHLPCLQQTSGNAKRIVDSRRPGNTKRTADVHCPVDRTRPEIFVLLKAAAARPDADLFLIPARLPFSCEALLDRPFQLQFLSNIHPKTDFSVSKPILITFLPIPRSHLRNRIPSPDSVDYLSLPNFPTARTTDSTCHFGHPTPKHSLLSFLCPVYREETEYIYNFGTPLRNL